MTRTSIVVGVDLAGSPRRPTGMCALRGRTASDITELYTDEEILAYLRNQQPSIVAIDAPLSLPPGRKSINDRNGKHLRICDEELRRRGIRFFPITIGPMRMLTERGIRLRKLIEAMRIRVIEIYPGAAQDVWNIPRKQHGLEKLRKGLERLGIRGLSKGLTGDELDAVSAAEVAMLYLRGEAEVYGDFKRGAIVMPKHSALSRRPQRPGQKA